MWSVVFFMGFKMAAENEILTSQFWNLLNKSEAHHPRKTNHNIPYSNNYISHEAVCSLYNDIHKVSYNYFSMFSQIWKSFWIYFILLV